MTRPRAVQPVCRPFFSFFGGKWTLATRYPAPARATIVEPFAGSAGYATRYADREVILVEREPVVASIWRWLVSVSVDEVMGLPLDPGARHALPSAPQALIGFWCGRGRVQPANTTTSPWLLSGKWPTSFWGPYVRQRIADQVPRIRHWKILEGDYTSAPDVDATWFVDPPYQSSRHYRARPDDYEELGIWTRCRRGQVIACEQHGATWLPFRPFHVAKSINRGTNPEVVWLGP
jgi:hypothetical protein